ncbi:MAG: polyhydroxyalkanoate depolymerase [Acetobacteraceae bacterium]|nr:polyhydroxyalkanoate depolymerase [Acetobacteraceae bacterium]
MHYELYDLFRQSLLQPLNLTGRFGQVALDPIRPLLPSPVRGHMDAMYATLHVLERLTRLYPKQPFNVGVKEDVVWSRPFCDVIRFAADNPDAPRVLILAPMSGHHATLLRGTVESLVHEHEVFITDWADAKYVPLAKGRFDLDAYTAYVMEMFRFMARGGSFHVLAVCQPCVPAFAATAMLSEDRSEALPTSLVLMSGPIHPGANETEVTRFALKHDLDWFERHVIHTVPRRYPGRNRRVYPGLVQLGAFMSTQISRHLNQHMDLFVAVMRMREEDAQKIIEFYDEYLAVQDLSADFYLDTLHRVFQRRDLAKGEFDWHGRTIDPGAIEAVRLVTIEGEKDDICAPGQTVAAHDMCRNLSDSLKVHHLQPGVGHFGTFSGSKYRAGILPLLKRSFAERSPAVSRPYPRRVIQADGPGWERGALHATA